MYDLGLVSISFRQNTPEEILKEMKKAGLKVIEWGSDVHAPFGDKAKLSQIVELQQKYGIKCSSYGSYFRLGVTPFEELKPTVAAAKMLGTNIVRIWCGDKAPELYSKEEKENIYALGLKAAELAKNKDVILCMECHPNTLTQELDSTMELMDRVGGPNFRMYWQPNQYKTLDWNLTYAEKISSFVEIVHTFNWKLEDKFPLIEGVSLWKEYLNYLNINKPLLLEFMPDGKLESLTNEAEALRKIAGEAI